MFKIQSQKFINYTRKASVLLNSKKYAHSGNKNFDHCMNLVKNHDYENYLCTMLLPNDMIRSAFAIRAFNVEMANVGISVRDPKIGLMRFKFWKDRINNMYSKEDLNLSGEPITNELALAVKKYKLSKIWLNRLIECREAQLINNLAYQTIKDVENFGELSVSPIYYLLLECLNMKNVNCDHVASHLGKSQILSNMVRSIPTQSKLKTVYIPIELLVKHKISQNDIINLSILQRKSTINEKGLKDLVFELCNISNQHLMKARKLSKSIPNNVNILFINSINIESFLNKIQKYSFDINNPKVHQRDSLMPFKLYYAQVRNKY